MNLALPSFGQERRKSAYQVRGWSYPQKVMPKRGERLSAEQVGLLRAWVDQGAAWPDSASVKIENNRNHWAFKPPVCSAEPAVKNSGWAQNANRPFVLARFEKEGLQPSKKPTASHWCEG